MNLVKHMKHTDAAFVVDTDSQVDSFLIMTGETQNGLVRLLDVLGRHLVATATWSEGGRETGVLTITDGIIRKRFVGMAQWCITSERNALILFESIKKTAESKKGAKQ